MRAVSAWEPSLLRAAALSREDAALLRELEDEPAAASEREAAASGKR